MFLPFLKVYMRVGLLAFEAQQVVFLRMLRLASGGPLADREWQRMCSEKTLAAIQIGTAAAMGAAMGRTGPAIVGTAVGSYRKRIRANRRRLSRP